MFKFIKSYLAKNKQCTHKKNFKSRKFKLENGTPMIEFKCFDCGYNDYGHVYANPDTWPDNHLVINAEWDTKTEEIPYWLS